MLKTKYAGSIFFSYVYPYMFTSLGLQIKKNMNFFCGRVNLPILGIHV